MRFGGSSLTCFQLLRTLQHWIWLTMTINPKKDFAETLPMMPQDSLKRIALDFFNIPPDNQDVSPSSALMPCFPSTDHLSLAIHALSQFENLMYLELGDHIIISPSIFWSADPSPTKFPSWPRSLIHSLMGIHASTISHVKNVVI